MKPEEIKDRIIEYNPEALLITGYDEALVGIVSRCGSSELALYSYKKLVEITQQEGEDMDIIDAIEYVDYNILGAYMGENTPMILMDNDEE